MDVELGSDATARARRVAGITALALAVLALTLVVGRPTASKAAGRGGSLTTVSRTPYRASDLVVLTAKAGEEQVVLRVRDVGRGSAWWRVLACATALLGAGALAVRRHRGRLLLVGSTVPRVPLRRRGPPAFVR